MRSFYDRAYRSSPLHRRHRRRRRLQKARQLFLLLGVLSVAIAVAFTVASFFARVSVRRWNWLLGGGLYLAAGVLLLLVRGVVGLWIAAEERVRPKGANAPAAEGELGDRSAANGQTSP